MKRPSFIDADTADRTAANATAVDAAIETGQIEAFDAYESATRFSTENIDAMVRASTAFNKVLENFAQTWSALAQETLTASASAATAMCAARSIPEAIELQADFTRATFERFVAQGMKVSQTSIAASKEAFEPIHERATLALVTLAKPVEQLLTKSLRVVA